jgi:phenylacetate-CoA ligase
MGATKVFPSQVEQVVLEEKGLAPHCQIVIDRVDGLDTLEVQVEFAEESPTEAQRKEHDQAAARITRRLDAVLGIRATVSLVPPRTIARAGVGKLRKVVDKRG